MCIKPTVGRRCVSGSYNITRFLFWTGPFWERETSILEASWLDSQWRRSIDNNEILGFISGQSQKQIIGERDARVSMIEYLDSLRIPQFTPVYCKGSMTLLITMKESEFEPKSQSHTYLQFANTMVPFGSLHKYKVWISWRRDVLLASLSFVRSFGEVLG